LRGVPDPYAAIMFRTSRENVVALSDSNEAIPTRRFGFRTSSHSGVAIVRRRDLPSCGGIATARRAESPRSILSTARSTASSIRRRAGVSTVASGSIACAREPGDG
jgi:hypothetical protein